MGLIGLDRNRICASARCFLVDVLLPEDRAAKFAPEELRRRQLAAMTAWILAAARTQAVVLAFEDLHWADPTSLDLMRALAERGAQAPLLIIATARPEFRPSWSVRSHHSVISLSPLDRVQIAKHGWRTLRRVMRCQGTSSEGSRRAHGRRRPALRRGGYAPSCWSARANRAARKRSRRPRLAARSLAARLDTARRRAGDRADRAQCWAAGLLVRAAPRRGRPRTSRPRCNRRWSGSLRPRHSVRRGRWTAQAGHYRFKHALIQDAAYENLLKSRRQALHARAAEILRESASPEPEAIAHHFTEAGLDDLAIEWWGKAGEQALRRSAFQEAIAHLGTAIEMADKAGATAWRATAGAAAPNQRLTQLHVTYGNALIAARGFGAPETTEAFAKARESASGDKDAPERLAADYGLWVGSYTRGELPSMRAHAAAFLSDVEARPDSPEAGVAHRAAGITCWFAGEYREARDHFERALALFQPGRDDDLAFRFGPDPGVAAMACLAIASWPLGEVDRAISLIDRMQTRIADLTHVGTLAYGNMYAALFELMRGDYSRAAPNAFELARLAREHELPMFRAFGVFLEGSARAESGTLGGGLEDMRRGAELLREQNVLLFDGLLKIALAEAEARAGDPGHAIAILDEALAMSDRTGLRAFEAELHRARGEILLKRDPASSAPAEDALLTAIAVAKQQGTRSFELRAALSLAKLYQSTTRRVEAHAILAPALEGFAPTPEMPEIAEAQALLDGAG